jgi:HlyD family secretion protein
MDQRPTARTSSRPVRRRGLLLIAGGLSAAALSAWLGGSSDGNRAVAGVADPVPADHREPGRGIRLAGTVEAVRAYSASAPRLRGAPPAAGMVLTRLVPGGTRVQAGDVLAEFDPQEQLRNARDRRSELADLEGQIRKAQAEQAAERAKDETALAEAGNDVGRAELDVRKNDLLPRIDAEKNELALEQAQARLAQLRQTFALKRQAAAASLRILEIRRDRALNDAEHAERNARLMTMTAPFAGLVVLKTIFRGPGQSAEVQEGEEVRPGVAILDVVDTSAMQVRALINQADIAHASVGQRTLIRLDAYPELSFEGRIEQIAPLATPSTMTPRVRAFEAVVSIAGTHQQLMPDLSAAVEIEVP